jgi:hypothetical protein
MTTACARHRRIGQDLRLCATRQRRARHQSVFGKPAGGWTSLSNRLSAGRWHHA